MLLICANSANCIILGGQTFRTKSRIGKYFEAEGRTDWKSKNKKGHHDRRCTIFHSKSSEEQKKSLSPQMPYSIFVFSCVFILLSRESDQRAIRARSGVAGHLSTTPRWGTTIVNLPACSSHCPFEAKRQAGKL